jgi:hypothetical protein
LPWLVPIRLERGPEVEGREHRPEGRLPARRDAFRPKRRVDVQHRQKVDQLMRLFRIGLRRQCPLGGLELVLATVS